MSHDAFPSHRFFFLERGSEKIATKFLLVAKCERRTHFAELAGQVGTLAQSSKCPTFIWRFGVWTLVSMVASLLEASSFQCHVREMIDLARHRRRDFNGNLPMHRT